MDQGPGVVYCLLCREVGFDNIDHNQQPLEHSYQLFMYIDAINPLGLWMCWNDSCWFLSLSLIESQSSAPTTEYYYFNEGYHFQYIHVNLVILHKFHYFSHSHCMGPLTSVHSLNSWANTSCLPTAFLWCSNSSIRTFCRMLGQKTGKVKNCLFVCLLK